MRPLLLLILLAAGHASFAQRAYTAAQIKGAADKALQAAVSARVFRSAACLLLPYYQARSGDEAIYDYVPDTGRTTGDFLQATVRYRFELPWPECPVFSHITGVTEVMLDSNLHAVAPPVLDSLPDFVLMNEPCGLMSRDEAIAIAAQHNFYIVHMRATLHFEHSPKRFVWYLSEGQTMSRDTASLTMVPIGPGVQVPIKLLRIDAHTGEKISSKMPMPAKW